MSRPKTDGLIGDSFLSYNSVTKRWQQTWLTNFGAYMFLTGTFQDGVLTLEGTPYHLEQEWRDFWVDSGMPTLHNPDKAFVAFCKSRSKRNPIG